jgi:Domain of unknown function (DUF3846)
MKCVILIPVNARRPMRLLRVTREPSLRRLQRIVGGYIEAVPHWDSHVGTPCVAWCNEEGKLDELPINYRATALWWAHLGQRVDDVLVGNVVLCCGFDQQQEDADDDEA